MFNYIVFKKIVKEAYLWLNDKTVKTRFFLDAEYARWEKFNLDSRKDSDNYGFVEKGNSDKKQKICYLVPGVKISGGIAVIFKHANMLSEKGYDVRILSLSNSNDGTWFPGQKVEIIPYSKTKKMLKSGEADVLVATAYSTAFTVDMANARRKIYFVQSDERRFFEDKKIRAMIERTYGMDCEYMTEAKWIQKWLKDEFGHDAQYVPNGIDEEIFHRAEPIEAKKAKTRILIEGSINVPFKGMDDAYDAAKDLDCELWIVSNNGKPKKDWRYDRFFENVPFGEMAKIYSSCDIFLKMSRVEGFFGPPMEAMACGCAVIVGKVTGYDEYIENEKNALVVEMGDVNAAKIAIQRLIVDGKLRSSLIENGFETARTWTWKKSIESLENMLK